VTHVVPATPADSPLTLDDVMSSPGYRDLMTPSVAEGDEAFPFDLPLLDPTTSRARGHRVRLSEFTRVRPVALIFGSYT
jgi:hypothetical protein